MAMSKITVCMSYGWFFAHGHVSNLRLHVRAIVMQGTLAAHGYVYNYRLRVLRAAFFHGHV